MWLVPPVVGKAFIDAKVVLAAEYAQVAFSLVVTLRAVFVVPAGSVPEGAALEMTGGVVSAGTEGATVMVTS